MPRKKEVDSWFAKYENPMKDVVQKVREIVLDADARIEECIKWQAPTFTFEGNLASFFPKSKKHASLMFHQGAKIPGKHSLLEGTGAVSRMVKLASVKEADAAKKQLSAIVKAWCDWRSEASGKGKPATKKTKAKPAVKKVKAKKPAKKKVSPAKSRRAAKAKKAVSQRKRQPSKGKQAKVTKKVPKKATSQRTVRKRAKKKR